MLCQRCIHLKFPINSEIAGKGLFAEKNFVKGDVVSYYYGALVYGNIGRKNKNLQRRYGEGVPAVDAKTSNKCSIDVHYEFLDTSGERYSAWIAPAPFCCRRFINDPQEHRDDRIGISNCSTERFILVREHT